MEELVDETHLILDVRLAGEAMSATDHPHHLEYLVGRGRGLHGLKASCRSNDLLDDSMRTALEKKLQAIDFIVDREPAPLLSNGFVALKPEFLPDGITFRVRAESLNPSTSANLYAGATLGYAEGAIQYRVGSGALRRVGPDTFQVADRPGGLTRQGQPWSPGSSPRKWRQALPLKGQPAHMIVDALNGVGQPQASTSQKRRTSRPEPQHSRSRRSPPPDCQCSSSWS